MLLASLERPYAGMRVDDLGRTDVVVMLGGVLLQSSNDPFGFDVNSSIDRVTTAIDLVRRGVAPALVVGGGLTKGEKEGVNESSLWLPWIEAWGLKPKEMHEIGPCRDTRHEGIAFDQLAKEHGWRRVALVTSASHMRRSEAVFRSLGFEVTCVACDFRGLSELESTESWLRIPSAYPLSLLENYLHEIIGWSVYRWRGWID